MTVSTTTARVSYAGNGSTTTFNIGFYFLADSHLKVILRAADGTETVKTLTTDYTVSGSGNPSGGLITMLTAPATGQTLVILRNAPQTQDVDYQPNDPFPATTHEQALDKLTMIAQQLQNDVNRSLKIAETDSTNLTTTVPTSTLRANKALVFGADGALTISDDDYNDQLADVTAQASAAASSASAAATSASGAATSASSASTSATSAGSSATAAAASAAAAAASAASGMYSAVQDKSSNYTVVVGDAGDLLRVSTGSGAVTITLPQISSVSDGFKVAVVKWTGDTNAVTIARSGSDTINGATSASIGSQYTQITFVADFETNQWFAATSGLGSTNVVADVFSGNGSTTAFTLSGDPGTKNNTYVFVGGVYQQKSTYSLSTTTLTFSSAPPSGSSNIEVVWTQPLPVGTPSDGTVTSAKLASAALTLPNVLNEASSVTLASASTVNIGAAASNTINISGTTTITAFDSIAAGAVRRLVFAGALTLTHNATSLILPGAASITTAAGDVAELVSLGSGNWRCFNYVKANGQAVVAPASAFAGLGGQVFTSSGTFTVPSGVTAVKVTVVGGGGSGAGTSGANQAGAGGGGGGMGVAYVTGLTPGGAVTVTVGAGATGTTGAGSAGGTSSFGAYCTATGGGGGSKITSYGTASGGAAGSTTGCDFSGFSLAGGNGSWTSGCTSDSYSAGSGASGTRLGFGTPSGGSGALNGTPGAGVVYGSGGGGRTNNNALSTSANGGNGANGIVIVEW